MPVVAALPPPAVVAAAPRAVVAQDPLRDAQAHLAQIRWTPPSATRPGPLVAVLDTGADGASVELRDALAPGARSFTPGPSDPLQDAEGHGTHVAGIIAARPGNGIGVAGVATARLLVVKVADATGQAGTSSLVRGIRYAVARRARVINISFGGGGFSAVEQEAIDDAVRAGALVVVAAGNGGRARREFPGAYRQVLTVGAVDGQDRPLGSSTTGPQVAVAAPGEGILSTLPGGRFGQLSGTSMAAAVVSGVAARVWAARPGLTAAQVLRIVESTARDVALPGRDDATGAGVVDLTAALAARVPPADPGEPNDEPRIARESRALLVGAGPADVRLRATVGSWRDPRDGYRVTLAPGETLTADLVGPAGVDMDLRLWRPGTPALRRTRAFARAWLAASSFGPGADERLVFTATRRGAYTVEVDGLGNPGAYRLRVRRTVT